MRVPSRADSLERFIINVAISYICILRANENENDEIEKKNQRL